MNKKAITLIYILVFLASLQIACSFTDLIPAGGEANPQLPPPDGNESQPKPDLEEETEEEGAQPPADQSSCIKAFFGSTNLSDGQEFQPGEVFQVNFTLVNTGTCTWDPGYSLVQIGGDLNPISAKLPLLGAVATGESVELSLEYTTPSQPGPYIAVWKMEDPEGGVFGQNDPPNAPIRIIVRSIPSGNPQPTPTPNPTPPPQSTPDTNPDASLEMFGVTLLDDHCYDLNSGAEVDCNDSSADIRYSYGFSGAKMYKANYTQLSGNQDDEPDKSFCQNASYAPLPHNLLEDKFFCFKIEAMVSTVYGWIRIERFDEEGVTFDFLTFKVDPPEPMVNTNLFVMTQADQVSILEGECYDVENGELNKFCSGIFAGFLYEETTKKSLTVMQINPNEMYFSAAMSDEPSKSDCQNATYNTTPIWPIQETSYYCYQFVPNTIAYYGWLRPTSANSFGVTFDYLTWESAP